MIAKSVSLTSGIAIPQACLARGNVVRSSDVKTANLADAHRADRGDLLQEGLTAAVTGRDGGVAASGPPPAAAYFLPRLCFLRGAAYSHSGTCVAPRGSGILQPSELAASHRLGPPPRPGPG